MRLFQKVGIVIGIVMMMASVSCKAMSYLDHSIARLENEMAYLQQEIQVDERELHDHEKRTQCMVMVEDERIPLSSANKTASDYRKMYLERINRKHSALLKAKWLRGRFDRKIERIRDSSTDSQEKQSLAEELIEEIEQILREIDSTRAR